MVQVNKYLYNKSCMMMALAFATENQSLEDSIYQLLNYHFYKDNAQAQYFSMSHNDRETLHTLMILWLKKQLSEPYRMAHLHPTN